MTTLRPKPIKPAGKQAGLIEKENPFASRPLDGGDLSLMMPKRTTMNPWLIRILIGISAVLLLSIFIFSCVALKKTSSDRQRISAAPETAAEKEPLEKIEKSAETAVGYNLAPRRLDGVLVSEELAVYQPLAVMIDNMADARPPSGLSQAEVVYEAVAEGDITRFLALFNPHETLEKIGPVRSARPYFLDWAGEYAPIYAHCGGSPSALTNLKNGKYEVFDLDQMSNGLYFWRDAGRYAPHNLYTSAELLSKFAQDKSITGEASFEPWLFKEDATPDNRPNAAKNPTIRFSANDLYEVNWVYDREKNDYLRHQNNQIHQDADGSPIRAKNVIIQYVETVVLDSYGRLATQTIGSGDAVIFQDGLAIAGIWKKEITGGRTRFFSQEGDEISLNRGTIWIEAVPLGKSATY